MLQIKDQILSLIEKNIQNVKVTRLCLKALNLEEIGCKVQPGVQEL